MADSPRRVKVCSVGEVPPDGMIRVEVDGTPILVANVGGELLACADTCTHEEGSLSEGTLDVDECTVECPVHNAVFSLRTGEALEAPAEDPVSTFAVVVQGDEVFVELPAD